MQRQNLIEPLLFLLHFLFTYKQVFRASDKEYLIKLENLRKKKKIFHKQMVYYRQTYR